MHHLNVAGAWRLSREHVQAVAGLRLRPEERASVTEGENPSGPCVRVWHLDGVAPSSVLSTSVLGIFSNLSLFYERLVPPRRVCASSVPKGAAPGAHPWVGVGRCGVTLADTPRRLVVAEERARALGGGLSAVAILTGPSSSENGSRMKRPSGLKLRRSFMVSCSFSDGGALAVE